MSQMHMQKSYARQIRSANMDLPSDAGRIWCGLKAIGSASIRKTMRFIQYNPGQSIVLIYFLILSCNCINNVLCDIEPQPANKFDDDDEVPHTLVSLFKDQFTLSIYSQRLLPLFLYFVFFSC